MDYIAKIEYLGAVLSSRHSLRSVAPVRFARRVTVKASKRYFVPLSLFLLAITTACAPVTRTVQVSVISPDQSDGDRQPAFVIDMSETSVDVDAEMSAKLESISKGQRLAIEMPDASTADEAATLTFSIDMGDMRIDRDLGTEVLATVASELGIMSDLADGALLIASAAGVDGVFEIADGPEVLAAIATELGIMSETADDGLILASAAYVFGNPDGELNSSEPGSAEISQVTTPTSSEPNNFASAEINESLLNVLLDRLLPAVGALPAAGQMGLAPEVIRLAGQQDRFWGLFTSAMQLFESVAPGFTKMEDGDQDRAIKSFEAENRYLFGVIVDIAYIVYYKDPRVHERIGWDGRPPQPDGNVMTPWDESVLDNARKREPFWRKV